MKVYLLLLALALVDQLMWSIELSNYIIAFLFIYSLYMFIDNLGKKANFFDIISLVGIIIYLVAPLLTYEIYNRSNPFARALNTYMTIDKNDYYSFAIPGTLLLIIGLNYTPSRIQSRNDNLIISRCKAYLHGKAFLGLALVAIGIISTVVLNYVSSGLISIVYYFSQLTFIGFLYLYFSNIQAKALLLMTAFGVLFAQSSITGMYGEFISWCVLGGILLFIGRGKFNILPKFILISIAFFCVLLLQSIKHEYRHILRSKYKAESDVSFLFNLIKERALAPSTVVTPEKNYGMLIRANQGLLVGRAMEFVPKKEEFAKGETIIKSIAASLVPRFIWYSKPEAGGRENICRFLGDCWKKDYSYNIGQLGEAYVNFGKVLGAIYMFIYGWFIRFSYNKISKLTLRYPTLILWVPLFYFMAISLETDLVTFLNAFVKALIFALMMYSAFKYLLNVRI